ncbi:MULTISPECIES: hypothetical protein [Mesorhizobium]|uniref:hypothetical protein n=1 Tax=Mesorhizobium TaxID=68287 RepID=UPI001FCEE242|nr:MULTISPECIES: hypothetical protein [Mesorhizobium]
MSIKLRRQPDVPIADDLPDIIGDVVEMGRTPEEQPAETPSLLFRPSRIPDCRRISTRSPVARETMSRRGAQPTRAAPIRRTGGIFRAGAAGRASRYFRQIDRWSGSTSRLAPRAATGDKRPNTVDDRTPALLALLEFFPPRGQPLDRKNKHIATVMAGIRNKHAAPPRQKEAVLPEDLIAMLERSTAAACANRAMLLLASPAACGSTSATCKSSLVTPPPK